MSYLSRIIIMKISNQKKESIHINKTKGHIYIYVVRIEG